MHNRWGRWRVLVYDQSLVSFRAVFPTTSVSFLRGSFGLQPTEEVSLLDALQGTE